MPLRLVILYLNLHAHNDYGCKAVNVAELIIRFYSLFISNDTQTLNEKKYLQVQSPANKIFNPGGCYCSTGKQNKAGKNPCYNRISQRGCIRNFGKQQIKNIQVAICIQLNSHLYL